MIYLAGSFCVSARQGTDLREMKPVPNSSLLFVLSFTPLFGYTKFPHLSHAYEQNSLRVVEISVL